MTTTRAQKRRARELQKKTGRTYQDCLRQVRRKDRPPPHIVAYWMRQKFGLGPIPSPLFGVQLPLVGEISSITFKRQLDGVSRRKSRSPWPKPVHPQPARRWPGGILEQLDERHRKHQEEMRRKREKAFREMRRSSKRFNEEMGRKVLGDAEWEAQERRKKLAKRFIKIADDESIKDLMVVLAPCHGMDLDQIEAVLDRIQNP